MLARGEIRKLVFGQPRSEGRGPVFCSGLEKPRLALNIPVSVFSICGTEMKFVTADSDCGTLRSVFFYVDFMT